MERSTSSTFSPTSLPLEPSPPTRDAGNSSYPPISPHPASPTYPSRMFFPPPPRPLIAQASRRSPPPLFVLPRILVLELSVDLTPESQRPPPPPIPPSSNSSGHSFKPLRTLQTQPLQGKSRLPSCGHDPFRVRVPPWDTRSPPRPTAFFPLLNGSPSFFITYISAPRSSQ